MICPTCDCKPTDLVTLPAGVNYGMWTACDRSIDSSSIVYAIGVGEDNSWDEAILKRYPGFYSESVFSDMKRSPVAHVLPA
jgi:hypothetical protein